MSERWGGAVFAGGVVLGVVVVLWLVVLTVVVLRAEARRGEPVYRRLPDGRTRFTWHVAQGLGRAQRAVSADLDLRSRS